MLANRYGEPVLLEDDDMPRGGSTWSDVFFWSVRRWSRWSGRERLACLAVILSAALLAQSVADFSRAVVCADTAVSVQIAMNVGAPPALRSPAVSEPSPLAQQLAKALASYQQDIDQSNNYQLSAEEQRLGVCLPAWLS